MGNNSLPDQQRAWVNIRRGTPTQALVLKSDWPVPKNLRPGEVLVKVHAAALNPVGYKLFKYLPNFVAGRPRVAEYDLSGVVVDSNGTRFQDGDHVFGWVPSNQLRKTDQGALSQYCKLSADWLEKRPPNVTPTQAAGFALAGLTAYRAVVNSANIQADQRVFINGGSSSVGAFAIQISKIRGAHVTTSASARNGQFVRHLGADEFVDYTSNDLPTYLTESAQDKKFDYIIDAVGNDPSLYTRSDKYLSPMGAYISVGPEMKVVSLSEIGNIGKTLLYMCLPRVLGGMKASFEIVAVWPNRKDLEQLQKYISDGLLKPVVDSVFSFDDALKAYDRLMSRRATGKVVVKVDPLIE